MEKLELGYFDEQGFFNDMACLVLDAEILKRQADELRDRLNPRSRLYYERLYGLVPKVSEFVKGSLDRNAVLDRVDMVALVESYGVKLRKIGNRYSALCCFHKDTNSSLSIWPDQKRFYCFGCQEKGSAFDFVMKQEGLNFSSALRFLHDRFGG